jgi:hypothetical protein
MIGRSNTDQGLEHGRLHGHEPDHDIEMHDIHPA